MRKQRHTQYFNCPVEAAFDLVGGKWKAVLLFRIAEQTRRFNELRRILPGVTPRALTLQLRELERDGLISRKVYAQVPPKVEYSATAFGMTLFEPLAGLATWAQIHLGDRIGPPTAQSADGASPT